MSPIAIFKQSALDSHALDRPFAVRLVFCDHPLIDSTHLIASISELITAVLHLDLNAESQDSTTNTHSTGTRLLLSCLKQVLMPTNLILTAGSSNHLQRLQTSSALQVLRDQVCRLLGSFLSKISSQTDIGSPYTLALSRQFENLLSATLRVEYKPQLPSVEQYRACFSQPVTNVMQSIVKRLTDQIGRVSHDREPEVDLLVTYTEQFCSLIYHLAAVDPGRIVAAQEQYNLISLLMDTFTALEHHLPMRTNLNEPLNPVWIDRVGLTAPVCSTHTESGSIGYTVNVRKFILSVVYGLYTLLISRLMPSETEMIQDLLMSVNLDGREQQHLSSVLINLLTHENLAVACATRDGLSRLILHARPSQPIAWFNIDHCSTLDGPSRQSTKRSVDDKSDAPSTKTSVPVSIPDESSRSTCQVTVTSSTHDGRVPVTPYTARRRPPRNSSQTNQRVAADEDEVAVGVEDLEAELRQLQDATSDPGEELENAGDPEDLEADQIQAEEEVEDTDDQEGQEEEGDVEDREEDEESEMNEDGNDLSEEVVNSALSGQMATFLAQLIAEVEQHNSGQPSMLSELQWPISSDIFDQLQDRQRRQQAAPSSQADDAPVPSSAHQPPTESLSSDEIDETAQIPSVNEQVIIPSTRSGRATIPSNTSDSHRPLPPLPNRYDVPTNRRTAWETEEPNSVDQIVDVESIESAIHLLGSGSQDDPITFQHLLEQVDDDALLNYALQLSLRDQGGTGVDGVQPNESRSSAAQSGVIENPTDALDTHQDDVQNFTSAVSTVSAPQASEVPLESTVPDEMENGLQSIQTKEPSVLETLSDSNYSPQSHILSQSYSVESIPIISDLTSDAHCSDSSSLDTVPWSKRATRRRRCLRQSHSSLLFALCIARHLSNKWDQIVTQASLVDHINPSVGVQRLVPSLQLLVTLVRTLHANVFYLHSKLGALPAGLEPSREAKLRRWLSVVRGTLKDLIHAFISSLPSPAVAIYSRFAPKPSTSDIDPHANLLQSQISHMANCHRSVAFELTVMQLNLVYELFSSMPHSLYPAVDPFSSVSSMSLLGIFLSDSDEGPGDAKSVVATTTLQTNELVDQTVDFCLNLLEVLHLRIQTVTNPVEATQDVSPKSFMLPTTANNPHAAGLLQASLLGTGSTQGLLAPSVATCLLSWSPLIEAQFALDHIANPLQEIAWLGMQASLRLPRLLLLLHHCMGSDHRDRQRRTSAHRKSSLIPADRESRWCSVLYDYLEVLTDKDRLSLQLERLHAGGRCLLPGFFVQNYPRVHEIVGRFERLIRGLLIRIVGAKHYRQLHDIHRLAHLTHRVREVCSSTGEFLPSFSCITTDTAKSSAVPVDAQQSPATPFSSLLQQLEPFVHQLRLPYVAQREILQIISSCLNIATDRTSYWQRFCLRCPDTLIFLIHASLVLDREIARIMLSLVQLAVTSHTTVVSSSVIGTNANDSQSANIAVERVPPGSSPAQTNGARLALSMAQHLLPMDSENTDNRSAQPAVSPLFLQFVRVFLCHCPDVGIRNTTAHIVREIYRSLPSSSQLHLLDLLPLVWPDLPTFAPHSTQFVQLTIELLVDHPEWTGRLNLLEHITRLMLRRLDALKRHPRRILYATLMHLIQPQRELGSQLPGSSTVNATSASDAQTIPRRPPEPPVAPRLANDISLSRSWSGLASLRQTISGQAAITSVPSTVPNVSVSTITTTNNGYADNVPQSSATASCFDVESSSTPLTNLGFVFELEPCLMCHAKATDDPFYVILRWDSDSGGSRVPIQVAMMTLHSHYGKFVDRLKQAMGQQQQQLIQRHALSTATSTVTATTSSVTAAGVSGGVAAQLTTNTNHAMPTASTVTASSTSNSNMIGQSSCTIPIVPVKLDVRATSSVHVFDLDAVYLISQLTVKFNILYKRQRYVRTLNVYTSDLIDRSASRLVHEPWMWQKVATVRLAPGQEAVRVCFSHPAPTPIWLGASQANYATDERFNADQLFSINSHYQGLAIRASRLIFEYADFHSTDSEANRDCPRCHTTDLLGIICPACHTNVNECTRCRSIDLSEGDVYLCANCGSSRNGKIEFSICARPCYSTVEPLHDREDRECACNRIVALSKELAKNAQLLARPLEVEVAQCLSDLVTMDAATTASVTSATWSGSGQSTTMLTKSKFFGPNMAALKSSPTADAKFLLAAASSAVSSLGSVHSGITRLAACVSEARAISLDAAAITRRLWAARQAVLQFDSAQQQIANAAETRAVSGTSTTAVSGQRPNLVCWPDYEELDGLFSSSISGCYSCLINTVHQCGRVLLGVAEHTPVHTVLDANSEQHWLFLDPAESDHTRVGIQSPPGFTVIRDLITSLMESGLSVCPQTIQADLRCLIIQLTRDCPALITYLGKLLVDRLTQTALAQGDQGYLLGPLVFNDMALLQASVESILPTQFASSTTSTNINEIPGRAQPMDQRATFWECRLRPLFKLLVELSRPGRFPIGRGTQLDRCQGPPLPVVQNILIPLVDLLENLVTQSNSIATPPATPLVSLRQSKLQSQYGHVDPPNSVTTTGGGSGENQPLSVSSTHTFVPLLTTAPYIDFSAWLDARPYASFPAWRDRIVTLQLLGRLRHRVSVLAATINTNAAADTHGTMDVARKQVLVARFAIRWRTIVSDLQWARRWGITLPPGVGALEFRATSLQTSIESIPSNSWILSVMFSPPDTTARCIHSCMDLLYALSAAPTTARRRCPPSSVAQKSRNPISLIALHGKRRRLVLRFLVESCLPRLDALAAYRGAAITPSALIGSADVRGLSNVFNAGDAFVIKLCKLTIGPDTSRLGSEASPKTGGSTEENKLECVHPPMVSFLLSKADILNHLGTLVDRMLLQMRRLETMTVRHWDELLAASLSSVSGTGGLHGGTPGYTLALVADLLRILEPLKQLPRRHQYKLLQILLHACVRLRQLVLQRTECTLRAQGLFSSMLDQLIGVSVSQIREFLTTTLNVLAEYPISDHQSAVYLLKRMCTPICPLDADQTVFHVSLEVWRGHEDYLLTRSRVELLSSDTRGLGPRIRNVIDYICTSNNLTTDMGLEIVCEGQILMPQLRLSDVYSQVWCANRQNVNKPMRLVYRIPGLESDSMPYLEQLTTGEIPPEQYQHISVLALHPHGLGDLLRRLATVHDPYQGRDLFDVLLHILHYCLKTPECRQRLIDPEVRSIPILLNALLVCLQADAPQSRQASTSSDLHEDITGRLVQIIEPILKMADEVEQPCPHADGFAAVTLPRGDLNTVLQLLTCMSEQPEVPLIGRDVARLLGLLAFGDQKKMDVIVQFVQTHLKDKLKPTVDFSRTESALLDCCCSLLLYIPRQSRNGALLHQQIVNQSGFLQSCLEFLWDSVPPCILDLDEEVALNTSDPEIAGFLALSALPHVLQVLRACVDGTQAADCLSQPETYHTSQSDRPRILAAPLLRFFHLLETSKSAGRVGLLAEDMLSEWCCGHDKLTETLRSKSSHTPDTLQAHNNDTLTEVIQSLRKATALRTRRLARNMRERQLRSMNMRVDEKGQVAVATSDRLLKMTATVTEEAGLACAICHEGFRSAPNEAMGIYAFVRQCSLEESLCFGQENATHTPPVSIPKGYSTLSNFVVVHFSCHANSLKVSSENQWVVAQRHNRDVKCNNLLPILGPPVGTYSTASSEASKPKSKKDQPPAPETVYAGHLANFMDFIMRTLSVSPGYVMALHDVKLLLVRFACNRSFRSEGGGGGRESNLQLLPHLMQVGLHSLLMSSSVNQKMNELTEFLELSETHWSSTDHCWNSTGPLYRTVAAMHLWPHQTWSEHRVALLRRLILVASGRLKSFSKPSGVTQDVETNFIYFKPYLLFFALVNGVYDYLFKSVSIPVCTTSGAADSWCASLSQYISTSDEALIAAVTRLLAFYQDDLLPITSLGEFADVNGLLGEVDLNELTSLMSV
ncbi:hypothetical protein EG68_03424 [Paragonimus skrjabini miyazakii]|uniref:E3 ubiquitin ligase UBR4 C-terminal domain-containing protein n=1 Tax=Paragonimus skrjabini miyazakii TaxID=59628 RepID=A0A8S9Z280_9TREM|nr:hypothetical protein EG68_03424 [Paragonimus skrjabini miyazakii]